MANDSNELPSQISEFTPDLLKHKLSFSKGKYEDSLLRMPIQMIRNTANVL